MKPPTFSILKLPPHTKNTKQAVQYNVTTKIIDLDGSRAAKILGGRDVMCRYVKVEHLSISTLDKQYKPPTTHYQSVALQRWQR